MNLHIEEYPDRDMMAIDVANVLAGELETALLANDVVSLAVPGGSTPGPVFDALCAADLDWARVRVMLSDERWVPEDHPRSNTSLIKQRLLTSRAAVAEYVPLYQPGRIEDVVPMISASLETQLPVSVLVLGMGGDMHTASLFPGAPDLAKALAPDAPALVVQEPDSQPETRVSLSARVLDGALAKHLLITGADKRAALERALELPVEQAPIRAVLSDMTIHWAE
jgi:6-phosphogluconolactonase